MARVVREQAVATTLMAQQMANENCNSNGHGNGHEDEYMQFLEFRKVNLWGAHDPDAADEWIKEMEKIFSILTCMKEQKVSCAAFMLKRTYSFGGRYWEFA